MNFGCEMCKKSKQNMQHFARIKSYQEQRINTAVSSKDKPEQAGEGSKYDGCLC